MSVPSRLLQDLDNLVRIKGFDNRSQAIGDMIRSQLVVQRSELGNADVAGTLTLVYDHHRHELQGALTDIQHDHHELIVSTLHVHLDHHNCLEVIVLRGKGSEIQRIADKLLASRGVKHGKLTITTTGKDLPS